MGNENYQKSLFIFRRDLRVVDNTGLLAALSSSKDVMVCFIFDPKQVDKNGYRSDNCVQFMLESLTELSEEIKKKYGGRLYFFYGSSDKVLEDLIKKEHLNAVFVNEDYTPFSKRRDAQLSKVCKKHTVDFNVSFDLLLQKPETCLKGNGEPYKIFTPFFRSASQISVASVEQKVASNFSNLSCSLDKGIAIFKKILAKRNTNLAVQGGRSEALKILRRLNDFKNYKKERDIPAQNATTHLSAHLKFGTVSIREVYHGLVKTFSKSHDLVRQLYWRDFFTHIAHFFPNVFGHAFNQKYDQIKWGNDKKLFKAWCEGKTGYPIVDAGMRELNSTGYMHNRLRMIVASFLVKDLHIDWRWGEKYFAQKLVDYDPCVNNGSWQWAASTGCDAQPYFRIFNPWRQQERFDSNCEYIKRWVPELAALDAKSIHKLEKQRPLADVAYPKPIVDHKEASSFAKAMFANCK